MDETLQSKLIYEPEDEAEALAVEALLVEAGVSCQMLPHEGTAFPGVSDVHRSWGEIRVAYDDVERAQVLVAEYIETLDEGEVLEKPEDVKLPSQAPPPVEHSETARSAFYTAAIPVLLVLSLGLNVYLYVQYVYAPFDAVVDTNDARDRLLYRQHFRSPDDMFSIRVEEFDPSGNKIGTSWDENANGRYEGWEVYEGARVAAGGADTDDDGLLERVWCENGDQRIVVDLIACREVFDVPGAD